MSNYPDGAEYASNAPYNQHILSEKEFECTICSSLSKSTKIFTNDYEVEPSDDYDEETGRPCGNNIYSVSEDTVIKACFQQHYTPLELINEFKNFLITLVLPKAEGKEKERCQFIISECEGWNIDDEAIIKD